MTLTKTKTNMLPVKNPVLVTQGRIPTEEDYQVGLDWLDFNIHGLSGQSEAEEILYQLGCLTSEVFDFSSTRAVFNGKSWSGSGRGSAGTMIWYQAPTVDDSILRLNEEGRYVGYEDILPPRNVVIEADAIAYARANLPANVRLYHIESGGTHFVDHGWRLEKVGKFNLDGQLKVAISGGTMSRIAPQEILSWLGSFKTVVFSRVDIALDDMKKATTLEQIKATVEKGDFFDAAYRCIMASGKRGEDWGETVYLGAPSSDKRMRIYDKTVESKGEIDCIRWEAEFRRGKADVLGHELIALAESTVEECTHYMVQVVCGVVEFRQRGENDEKNRTRCPLVDWWAEMLERLKTTPVSIRLAKIKQTIQRGIDWLSRSVAPTLAAIEKVLGQDFPEYFQGLLFLGGEKMNKVKRDLIEITDKEQLCY